MKGELTLIIIAHRISTLKNVDTIALLDKGNIIQMGTFKELKQNSNTFQKLISHQDI